MMEAKKGEVIQLGRLMDSDLASSLGDKMLKLYATFIERSGISIGGTLNIARDQLHQTETVLTQSYSNEVTLSNEDFDTYRSVLDEIRDGATVCLNHNEPNIVGDFFIGSAAAGRWHIDGNFDYRVLVNLSRFPISLFFITERPVDTHMSDWETILDQGYKPDSYDTITYEPGEAIALNNFCSRQEQVLHVGSNQTNKVFIRYIAENPGESDFLRTTLS